MQPQKRSEFILQLLAFLLMQRPAASDEALITQAEPYPDVHLRLGTFAQQTLL